jgi:hypothetical protein
MNLRGRARIDEKLVNCVDSVGVRDDERDSHTYAGTHDHASLTLRLVNRTHQATQVAAH